MSLRPFIYWGAPPRQTPRRARSRGRLDPRSASRRSVAIARLSTGGLCPARPLDALAFVHWLTRGVHLRAPRFGGQPSLERSLACQPKLAERRLEPMTRIELVTSSLPRTRSAN